MPYKLGGGRDMRELIDALRRVANTVSDSTSGGDILRRLAAELEKPSTQKTAPDKHGLEGQK